MDLRNPMFIWKCRKMFRKGNFGEYPDYSKLSRKTRKNIENAAITVALTIVEGYIKKEVNTQDISKEEWVESAKDIARTAKFKRDGKGYVDVTFKYDPKLGEVAGAYLCNTIAEFMQELLNYGLLEV